MFLRSFTCACLACVSALALPTAAVDAFVLIGAAVKILNFNYLKNIDIDSQHLNYEISSIPRESW